MNRSIVLSTILFIVLVLLVPIPTVRSATLYVGDPAACGVSSTYPDLSSAIGAAVDGDTIIICNDIYDVTNGILLNKKVVIDGFYNGVKNGWQIYDSSPYDPFLTITSDVVIKNLNIVVSKGNAPAYPVEVFRVENANVTFENISYRMYRSVRHDMSVFKVINGVLNILSSDIRVIRVISNLRSEIINSLNSDLVIKNSYFYITEDGSVIRYVIDSQLQANRFLLDSTYLYTTGSFVVNADITGGSSDIDIIDTTMIASGRGVKIYANLGGDFTLDILGSSIKSYISDAVFTVLDGDSSGNVYINPSVIDGYQGFIATIHKSNFNGIFKNSKFVGNRQTGLAVYASYYSNAYVEIRDSEIHSYLYFPLRMYSSGYSTLESWVYNSTIKVTHIYTRYYSAIDIQAYNSLLKFNILNSELKGASNTFMAFAYRGDLYAYVYGTTFDAIAPQSNLYLNTWRGGFIRMIIERSLLGVFILTGDGRISLSLIETVYDELNSDNGGFPVYSEWSVGAKVFSSLTMLPIMGAKLTVFIKGAFVGSSPTNLNGFAFVTLKYNYTAGNPVIRYLAVVVEYKGVKNSTRYTDIEPTFTMPYWFYNFTFVIKVAVLKANVGGSAGFGVLSIEGVEGKLLLGSKGSHTPTKILPIALSSTDKIGRFLVIGIKMLYEGSWTKGYVLIDLKKGTVYLKVGGLEMYGHLVRG